MLNMTKYIYSGFLKYKFKFHDFGDEKVVLFEGQSYSITYWAEFTDEDKLFIEYGIFK